MSTLDGCDAADVMLLGPSGPVTIAATDSRASVLDDAQYAQDDGPCLDAARTRHINRIDSTRAHDRWGYFCGQAVQAGVLSTLAVPLIAGDRPIGALNLFSTVEEGFPDAAQASAVLFAAQAAVAVANAQTHAAALAAATQFEQALASRAVIDQAKGILIATRGCSPDAAFAMLRDRSQHQNRKLHTVAEEIVDQAQR